VLYIPACTTADAACDVFSSVVASQQTHEGYVVRDEKDPRLWVNEYQTDGSLDSWMFFNSFCLKLK